MSAYMVLARKWRPQNFAQLAGQSHVARALQNALTSGRIPHAFLFTGVRGVGKTTIARLFAKCLNCEKGVGPDPCGVCDACKSVAQGNHPDVMEVDAASRTKVDQMREILDSVCFVPSVSPFKVYILDEVHMLTVQSFNALLKTLEEPPAHVKFIFATTEPRKIPATILSRCQRYDLKRLTREELTNHLNTILGLENIPSDEEAVKAVVRAADGSVRDALSLLDQVISHGDGAVRYEAVEQLLGLLDRQAAVDLLEAMLLGNLPALNNSLELFYRGGTESGILINELLELVHQVTRYKVVATYSKEQPAAEDRFALRLQDLSRRLAMEHLQMAYQTLLRGRQDVRLADFPIQALEMLIYRVAYLRPATDLEQLLIKLGRGEGSSSGGGGQVVAGSSAPGMAGSSSAGSVALSAEEKHVVNQTPSLATWDALVGWIGDSHKKLALKLQDQVVCLAYTPASAQTPLNLTLRMTHEVFGSPDRLRAELVQALQERGISSYQMVLEGAMAGPRPETIAEGRERESRLFVKQLEDEIRCHPAVILLEERLGAELLRMESTPTIH